MKFNEEKIKKLKHEIVEADNVASEVLRSLIKNGMDISRDEVAYLLGWAGDDEDIDVDSIFDENYKYHKLRTVGKIDCPVCGQELVRKEEDCDGRSEYWCDKCNLDIRIDDGERIPKIEEELSALVGPKMSDKMMEFFYSYSDKVFEDYNETHPKEASNLIMACSHIKFKTTTGVMINYTTPDGETYETVLEASSPQELESLWIEYCEDNDINVADTSINMVNICFTDNQCDILEFIEESANQFINSIAFRSLSDMGEKLVDIRNDIITNLAKTLIKHGEIAVIPHMVEEIDKKCDISCEYIEDKLELKDSDVFIFPRTYK